jgi:four helix bundle protein
LRRTAVSVVSNIAEGKGRFSDKELLQFLDVAKGSLFEVETQLLLAGHLGYLTAEQAAGLASQVGETGRLLNGLIKAFEQERKLPRGGLQALGFRFWRKRDLRHPQVGLVSA